MDHLTTHQTSLSSDLPAPLADSAWLSSYRKLVAGKAITLRAKQLSVLRITHGRVWVTLSDASSYSRVLAGDHFLSQGQSLTLLPGQALVMEAFEPATGTHTAPAHFSWEALARADSALQAVTDKARASAVGVLEPLHDLRHALGLVAGASGRLACGLAHGAAAAPAMLLNVLAIPFVAVRADTTCAGQSFDMTKNNSTGQVASCRTR